MNAIILLKQHKNRSEVARSIGVTPQTLNNWVGRKNIPSKYLKDLAKALGVKVENLL